MEPVLLAVDTILKAIIGAPGSLEDLLVEARAGKVYFVISDFALFCALSSVENDDQVDLPRLAELIKYSQAEAEDPAYLGPRGRESWTPTTEEIQNWRASALQ